MGRERILEILEKNQGHYVSGEEISEALGISRSAVWKQIKALREQGYQITGSTHRGYLLLGRPDILYPREIQRGLKTLCFGKQFYHFRQVGSTNQVAQELARKGCPEGTAVVAEEQTAGKGRWQRTWVSPPELGIWLSLILRPALSPPEVPQLTLVAGVAGARAIQEESGLRLGIKWPNDLTFGGKKVCGILVEMDATAEQVSHLILGIGINVNQGVTDFPPELRDSATSLRILLGQKIARVPLARRLLEVLEEEYFWFCRHGFARTRENWGKYEVTLGRIVKVREGKKEYLGEAFDLGSDGCLLLRLAGGEVRRCAAGEVVLCRETP